MQTISAHETAKLLGVSVDELQILEKQGLLHVARKKGQDDQYSATEIAYIKSRRSLTVSEEAAQVATQIQQEVFSSVSHLMQLRKRIFVSTAFFFSGFILLVLNISILFYVYPLQTSDFFGYY